MISIMREMNLAGVDLNLLPPLQALLKRRNVTHAAADVGLSQPAMSRALARLRDLIGDPLLVRTPGGYALTPRAEAISRSLPGMLDELKHIFREPAFDPAQIRRIVRIAGVDPQTVMISPGLMARLAREAPGVDIRMEAYSHDMMARMESGALDLAFAIGGTPLPPGALSESYGRDRLALVMRRGHPMARKRWTVTDYGRVDHAGVSIFGDGASDLDATLGREGVQRRIAIATPHFIAALSIVAETDLVTTISRAYAQRFAAAFDLILKEPPLPGTDLDLTLVWSRIRTADPLLTWLRGVIRDVAARETPG
jgi:DNA-binding transcriptional LysR family regulator